jgi:tyrosinase
MAISRRDVLLRGSAIGVDIIATNVPGLVAFAQPLPPLRRSLHGLALNDPTLQAWRDGVRLLKARPASDPVSWANFAATHGSDACFNLCPHGNWYGPVKLTVHVVPLRGEGDGARIEVGGAEIK